MNTHFYLPQPAHLQQLIHSIWQVERFSLSEKERIIPKGIVEVIFNFSAGAPILAQISGKHYQLPACFINGFNTVPLSLQLPSQQVFFGVVFQPLAVKKIFRTPAHLFSDQLVDLTLLDTAFGSLWHQLAEQAHFESRVTILCGWVEKNFFEGPPQEKLINNFLYATDGHTLSVKELAEALCYSPRHLSRKLLEATGMNTEEILLYKKYLHAVHLMHHTDLSLTEISHQSYFFDQSHFIRAFKAYTGMTPGEYKPQQSHLKGHLYENVR